MTRIQQLTEEDREEIVHLLNETIERYANERAAQSWSYLGDQSMMNLEEQGFDDQTAVSIAWFDWSVAVNSDLTTTDPKTKKIVLWSEVIDDYMDELSESGYELTDLGGRVPVSESEIPMDHVFEFVANELNIDADVVAEIARKEDLPTDYYYMGGAGEVQVWVKRIAPPWDEDDTTIDVWSERDNAYVGLKTLDERVIVEWRNDHVREAVDDGYLDPKDYHGSAVEYANEMNMGVTQ